MCFPPSSALNDAICWDSASLAASAGLMSQSSVLTKQCVAVMGDRAIRSEARLLYEVNAATSSRDPDSALASCSHALLPQSHWFRSIRV